MDSKIKRRVKLIKQYLASFSKVKNSYFLSERETINFLLQNHSSFIRFGDGEFNIMEGESIHYQQYNKKLAESLIDMLDNYQLKSNSKNKKLLIGMPGYFLKQHGYYFLKSKILLMCWTNVRYLFKKKWDKDNIFGDAFVFGKGKESIYKDLWLKSSVNRIIFVHNNKKYAQKFQEKYDIKTLFVSVPSKNAYHEIESVIKKIEQIPQFNGSHTQILISAGPAAKILTYKLLEKGCWAIDTGHCWDDPLVKDPVIK